MKRLQRIAFIGNHLPRRCGIATFTHDLHRAVADARPDLDTCVVAMNNSVGTYAYPEPVRIQLRDDVVDDYLQAAKFLNRSGFDLVSLQHEYGIFGGVAGSYIVELLSRLEMPIVTTLHTVLSNPSPAQRDVMSRIIERSSKLVVMSEKGRNFLRTSHDVPAQNIEVIAHGIPDFPFLESTGAKQKLGFEGRTVILTFGLLSPSKGIETVIDAMPEIIRSCPTALYVVLGATHPNLLRDQGEAYRDSLTARIQALGVDDHVVFLNQFVDQPTLLDFISMCDVYVTPYLNEAQMTSGTLAYSYGLGKAIVSTSYWHANELLADGRGILVPFGDSGTIGKEISALLVNDVRRHAMRKRAYAASRSMTWPQAAKAYLTTFESVLQPTIIGPMDPRDRHGPRLAESSLPEIRTDHLLSMCDSTGLLQHAVYCIPDRSHGYCVDDNARALLLASTLAGTGEPQLPEILTTRFAAFVQHAWNPATQRFRNFMSYDRRWLEDHGSEDSHGRTLWALAVCAAKDTDPGRRTWAKALFKAALPAVEAFTSPRAWAFTLLALDAYSPSAVDDASASRLRAILADRLMTTLAVKRAGGWVWFEDVLAYDNARLPQALIQTAATTGNTRYAVAGLRSLRWLMSQQTAPSGDFRPVGSHSFGHRNKAPAAFDQQPVEAAATISACLAAARVDKQSDWPRTAMSVFGWFLGDNDLSTSLVDPNTGACMDGLHPDRPNENRGAESVVSYLLGLVEMRRHAEISANIDRVRPPPLLPLSVALSA
jgi:glycosyltransferase involved in cell wall biosynthesis